MSMWKIFVWFNHIYSFFIHNICGKRIGPQVIPTLNTALTDNVRFTKHNLDDNKWETKKTNIDPIVYRTGHKVKLPKEWSFVSFSIITNCKLYRP